MTNGRTNWYRVVRSSRSIGANSPADQNTGYGTEVNFGSGAPTTVANRCASSRTVNGGFVGTSQAFPQARSSVATVTSVVAASPIEVQLCGTSNAAGRYARLPASTGAASPKLKMELASR